MIQNSKSKPVELIELVQKHYRFNVKGFVYEPQKSEYDEVECTDCFGNRLVKSPLLERSLISLIKTTDFLTCYKFNGQNVTDLQHTIGVDKSNQYLLETKTLDDELLFKLLTQAEDEPCRGSILFQSEVNEALREFIKHCYDPNFLTNPKQYISEPILRKAKQNFTNTSKVTIALSFYGLDTIMLFSNKELITELCNFSCHYSRKSAQFKKIAFV